MANLGQLQSFCRGINHLSPAPCNFNQRDKSRAEGELELGFALDLVFFPFISSSAPVGGTGEKLEQENTWGFLMPRLWMGRECPESPEMNPGYSMRRAGFLKQRGFFQILLFVLLEAGKATCVSSAGSDPGIWGWGGRCKGPKPPRTQN